MNAWYSFGLIIAGIAVTFGGVLSKGDDRTAQKVGAALFIAGMVVGAL